MVLFLSLSGQIEAQSTISVILPGFSLSVAQDMAGISRGEDGGELVVRGMRRGNQATRPQARPPVRAEEGVGGGGGLRPLRFLGAPSPSSTSSMLSWATVGPG